MDANRKSAYLNLLFVSLVRIRSLSTYASEPTMPQGHYVRDIGVLANWLLNLAEYAAVDFEGFDEELFWSAYERSCLQYPDSEIVGMRFEFDDKLYELNMPPPRRR